MSDLGDGTPLQDGLRLYERKGGESARHIPYPVTAQVMAIYYVDEEENRDGETLVADLHVMSLGIDLYKVPLMLPKAGVDDYISFGLKASEKNVDKSPFDQTLVDPKLADGDTVIVMFLNADVHQPIIIGTLPHNQGGFGGMSKSQRQYMEKGDEIRFRKSGTEFAMDKDGNVTIDNTNDAFDEEILPEKKFELKFKSKKDDVKYTRILVDSKPDAQQITLSTQGGHFITLDDKLGDEAVYVFHSKGALITMDKDGSVKIVCSDGAYFFLDALAGSISLTSKDGSIVTLKDNIVMTDKTGAQMVEIKEDMVQIISAKDVVLNCNNANIQAGKVDIGDGLVRFKAVLYEQLRTVFDAHTHATAVGPSGPPTPPNTLTVAEATPATSAAADYVSIRGNLA